MSLGDPVDILLNHDRWATLSLLDACAPLGEEAFHRRFEMGIGSLHGTFVHIVGAMWVWTDTLAARSPRPWIDEAPRRTVAELKRIVAEAADDLRASAKLGPMEQELKRERMGVVYTYTRGTVITHVTTHGMHHRAQILNMLRQLGVSPLPQSSVVEWSRAGSPEG